MRVRGLSVAYGAELVLRDVDLDLPQQELIAIVGPNGAGKSTLLKAMLGLLRPIAGEVTILGRGLDRGRRLLDVAYVPQRESVDWDFPTTALDVVAMGLYGQLGWFRRLRREHHERARACLAQMGIAELAERQIAELSGGQQQRVFLARALAQDARLYLMDEPFAGVDAATERAVLTQLRELRAAGKTVIAVHHDLGSVARTFDRAVLLAGEVIAEGVVAEALRADRLAAAYGTSMSLEVSTAASAGLAAADEPHTRPSR
ncbi:MAG: manganese ABC transporter ATP-binding protein [Proteobacteria bacterium]|nr:MAG: manganese ABC transporter ATP-binding protein [Pseudomonadota bacterium]PIE18593.1 MAG: manganese ABC transporter ATP-binding protein [Pseudomonadota bacterium]